MDASARWARWLFTLALVLLAALPSAPAAAEDITVDTAAPVLVTRLDGPVSPVTATDLLDAVAAAERDGAAALVVEIDTPGGLVTSMREVIAGFLEARVPVITYVTPRGARAASAGALIAMSGHVAAMAPTTTIGAATPVTPGGDTAGDKVIADLAASAEAIARARGRDVAFARAAVEQGSAIVADEALSSGVIDLIAEDRLDLLSALDGTQITLDGGDTVTLALASAPVEERDPGVLRSLLARLVDPNLTFVLLGLGILALVVEFAVPGVGAGGFIGVILLLLSAYSLSLLPTNAVGVALLLLAVGLFVGELFVPGVGIMAVGGTVSLVVAGLFLFDDTSGVAVSRTVLIPVALVLAAGSVALTVAVRNAQVLPRRLDDDQLVDQWVQVVVANGEHGQVMFNGERWHVRTLDPPLERGSWVQVLEREGLTLLVEPEQE